jgi:mannose-1-phosphate guanylyltransferase
MIVPVILSGGSGTRLWPLSRKLHPKQFIEIQTGDYLGEDDIIRIEDDYERS